MTRKLEHPEHEIEGHGDDLLIRFWVSGSTFGTIEIVLSPTAADELSEALAQAVAFS